MKAYCRSGDTDPRILNLGTRWRWVVSFTLRPLYLQEEASCTHWIGGWVGTRAGLDAVTRRNHPILRRESNPCCPSRSLVTILTELSRIFVHTRLISLFVVMFYLIRRYITSTQNIASSDNWMTNDPTKWVRSHGPVSSSRADTRADPGGKPAWVINTSTCVELTKRCYL
jgi:hypothetical protein